jgi:hypothetical protein
MKFKVKTPWGALVSPPTPQMSDFSDARYFGDMFDILGLNAIATISYRHINPVICSDVFDIFGR